MASRSEDLSTTGRSLLLALLISCAATSTTVGLTQQTLAQEATYQQSPAQQTPAEAPSVDSAPRAGAASEHQVDEAVEEVEATAGDDRSSDRSTETTAAREPAERRSKGDRRHGASQRGGRRTPTVREAMPVELDAKVSDIDRGFVFLEGVYFSPPYTIEARQGSLFVNDQRVDGSLLPGDHRENEWNNFDVHSLAAALRGDEMLLGLPGQPAVMLSPSFDGLSLAEYWSTSSAGLPQLDMAPHGFDHAKFNEWLSGFRASPELKHRSSMLVAYIVNAKSEADSAFQSVKRREMVHYLATVAGMVLSVLATGHLLQYRPATNATQAAAEPEMQTMASRSLVLVTVLSSFDLFWTLMAAQSGAMTELNPLGSHLLSDPSQLVAFKATITLAAVGLLFFLRRHHQAQRAAWWACLICTMLMFRWLTFNSMFMS